MPELPDVENYRRFLQRHALHKRIDGVKVESAKILKDVSAPKLARALKGREFESTRRHGKHLLASLDGGGWLAFHFGMTGRFERFRDGEEDPKHDRLRLDFAGGEHLAFINRRLLGRVELADDADDFVRGRSLGPDALSLDERGFAERLSAKRRAVKSALMDQSVLAGIGNVYSDEILYHAGLHPKTSTGDLDRRTLKRLHRTMRRVLETAVEKGAGSEDVERRVPRSWLLPRRRDGADCPRCGGRIEALKMQGRTAYLCPRCQGAP